MVSKNHPTIQGSISLEQFLQASFIEYEPTGGSYGHFREHADRLFKEKNIQRKVSVKMAYLSGIESIIASSVGVNQLAWFNPFARAKRFQ